MNESNERKGQATLSEKLEALNYHRYQLRINPKHKQSDTIRHFRRRGNFLISRSSLNRWINSEGSIRHESLKLSAVAKGKSRIIRRTSNTEVENFFQKYGDVIKCLEIYLVQSQVADIPSLSSKNIIQKFREFFLLVRGECAESGDDPFIDDMRWVLSFSNNIYTVISSIANDISIQKDIQKGHKSLKSEKIRLARELGDYSLLNTYEFREIIFDMNTLFELKDFESMPTSRTLLQVEGCHLGLFSDKRITLGLCCNLEGSDIRTPLLISNLSYRGGSLIRGRVQYDPLGLNRRDIFMHYLIEWNLVLSVEGREIALLLDTYWCHLGMINKLSNIKVIYINSKFDLCTSLYHSSKVKLPLSFGMERYVKYKVKVFLLKRLNKHFRHKMITELDEAYILNCVKICFEVIIDSVKSGEYGILMKLGSVASQLYKGKETQLMQIRGETSSTELELSNSQTAYYHEIGSILQGNTITFSDSIKEFIIKDEEKCLAAFIKSISRDILDANFSEGMKVSEIYDKLFYEITNGHNERKYNKLYSPSEISEYVKLLQRNSTATSLEDVNDKEIDFYTQERRIENFLVGVVEPFLSRLSYNSSTILNHMDFDGPCISTETLGLFHRFYLSFTKDTSNITRGGESSKKWSSAKQGDKRGIKDKANDTGVVSRTMDTKPQQVQEALHVPSSGYYIENFSDSD